MFLAFHIYLNIIIFLLFYEKIYNANHIIFTFIYNIDKFHIPNKVHFFILGLLSISFI